MKPLVIGILMVLSTGVARLTAVSEPSNPVVGLKGSKHDFSGESWTSGDLCIACHYTQRSDIPEEAPLWNPSANYDQQFGNAFGHSRRDRDRWTGAGAGSLRCMPCHDGTVASDMFGGLSAPRADHRQHPILNTALHGASNHPVGVPYPTLDRGFRPISAVLAEGQIPLPDGKVECVSCHDPHNESGVRDMLTKSDARSALCLTCHKK